MAGYVPNSPLTTFYTNTTAGTPASPEAVDAAMQAIVTTVNENYEAAQEINNGLSGHKNNTVLDHPDQSVTTAKIKDANVTTVKLADASVTGPKIAPASITSAHIATGATSETINGARLDGVDVKLNDIAINVKHPPLPFIGVTGDGVTDDHNALQALFNLAQSNGRVKLYFPEGVYCNGTYLRLYGNTFVDSHPLAEIKRIGTVNKVFINGEQGNSTYATGYNGEGNIHFNNISIDLNSGVGVASTMTVSCFDLGHGENISFTGVKIRNGQIGHYFQVSSCKNVKFNDCWFGDVVYSYTASADYELIQIEVATASSFPSFGGYDLTISRDIFIENCTFDGIIRAIGHHGDATYGTGSTIFCENIQLRNCTFTNSFDDMLHLTGFKGFICENNTIVDSGENAVYMIDVEDSIFEGNTIVTAVETGIFMSRSHGNKFYKNYIKDVGLGVSFAAIRALDSDGNTFDDDTVYAAVPNYTYAFFISDGSIGNKILTHNFTAGVSGLISGSDATEVANIQMGAGQTVLFDGDLDVAAETGTLSVDARLFNFLVVVGNDNGSAVANLTSVTIPKAILLIGATASRFRLLTDDSAASDRVEFSFPTATSIRADVIGGTSRIRKVIGVL